ncbi:hypothetical protein [Lignipirellula cremea]|uniref:Uncharacterized protein n=1 Tax=Lignipirellula cremea TaxID=2528010 RepID=A0A518DZ98_9BACT|nr:hypothetical protein [Lignipirellula cremea]QDU97170.1 hypothetical protein Pla8534_50150 [Lignipirellula cremea]
MAGLQLFWTWAYIIGLSAFALLVLLVIPLGLRDLLAMLGELKSEHTVREQRKKKQRKRRH